jgi:hypothetical protein
MSYRHGEAFYEIQVENPEHCARGVAWVEMDGQRIEDGVIRLVRDLVKHRVVVRMCSTPAKARPHRAIRDIQFQRLYSD